MPARPASNKGKKALFDNLADVATHDPYTVVLTLHHTDPDYYFGYDSAAFRDLVARHGASTHPRERQRLFADIQRKLTADAINAWLFAPQISTVACKGLQGLWMNYPIFAHDLAALPWH